MAKEKAPQMQIEYWDIERLQPYARNPRKNDEAVPKMAGLIREFGFKVPVIVRSTGEVIDGHLRLKAAWSLGMTQIPVVIADEWTDAQVKAFRLAVNRSAEWAEWDDELLKLELDDLKLENFDLELIGFDELASEPGKPSADDEIPPDDFNYEQILCGVVSEIRDRGFIYGEEQDEKCATWEPSIDRPPVYRPDLIMLPYTTAGEKCGAVAL